MNRQTRMQSFIKESQSDGANFINMLIGKCPEFLSENDIAYMHSDMQRNIELYFSEALEQAKEADNPAAITDHQENLDREKFRDRKALA